MSIEMLKKIYLFKDMPRLELEKLDKVINIIKILPGNKIFSQGDPATALYAVKFGSVRLSLHGAGGDVVEVAVIGTGGHFGEMPMLDGEARFTNAEPVEACELIEVDYKKLKDVLKDNPEMAAHFYKAMADFLARRLRVTTMDLNFSRQKNLSHF